MPHKDAHTNATKKRANRSWRVGKILLPGVTCAVICLSPLLHVTATTESKVTLRQGAPAAWPDGQGDVGVLVTGVTIKREIKGSESHHYQARFEADQYARVVIKRLGVNLLVTASAPGQRDATIYESPAGPQSPFVVSLVAEAPGLYDIHVRPVERWAAEGWYEISLEDVRPAGPGDHKRTAAGRKVAEARRLQLLDTEDSRRAALAAYEEALALWKEAGDDTEQANTLHFIAQTYKASGGSYFDKAVESYGRALTLRPEEDAQARAYTYLGLAELYRDLKNPADSLPHYQKAIELFEAGNNARGRAAALYGRGLAKALRREMSAALKDYEAVLLIYGSLESRDRHEEARTLQAMGGAYEVYGDPERALEFFNRALEGWRETGDPAQVGNTYNSIAKLADDRGDWQEALDNYEKALTFYEQGEAAAERGKSAIRRTRAITLYNLGFTYAALGDYEKAGDLLKQSLPLRGDNKRGQGITHMAIGYVHALAGEPREALESCDRALPLQKEVGDPRESHTLTVMGIARAALGEHREALVLYNRALEIQQNKVRPDPQAEAITQVRRGDSLAALGDVEQALAAYGRSRQLYQEFKDRNGESVALFGIARVESSRNNLTAALKLVEDALEAAEPLRSNVTSQQLRVSYFAAKVNYYELYIDLCMRLRAGSGEAALTAAAFEASERARARSLLDVLSQARVETGRKADPELAVLADKYMRLQRELQSKKAQREQAARQKESPEIAGLDSEIAKLYAERESAEAQMRSRYPRYAALMYPRPLTAADVRGLLDDDTLLLEFDLGEERSYVWALTATELKGYALPPRSEIEAAARRLSKLLRAGQPLSRESAVERASRMSRAEAEYRPLAAEFSRTLLGQVAPLLKKQRLLIVADGQLSYLPFGALPPPAGDAAAQGSLAPRARPDAPLVTDHEIVSLPSASVLSVLRQTARREQASKSVAVFADPVFERDDPRLQLVGRARPNAETRGQGDALARALRETDDGSGEPPKLQRLLASGRESRDIISLAPPGSSMEATGFKASRENVFDARLSQYRVVHFATHSILNEKNPELSGVVLSLYDEQGRFRESGFLRLGDIFGLSMPVDLVVLSACRTGLGKEIRGEGLIGLTRGFMYAGSPRVIASLWKVDDDATAELMKRFYQKLLKEGLTPAASLRAAQSSMSEQRRWGNPYYWAGFVLQGEPK